MQVIPKASENKYKANGLAAGLFCWLCCSLISMQWNNTKAAYHKTGGCYKQKHYNQAWGSDHVFTWSHQVGFMVDMAAWLQLLLAMPDFANYATSLSWGFCYASVSNWWHQSGFIVNMTWWCMTLQFMQSFSWECWCTSIFNWCDLGRFLVDMAWWCVTLQTFCCCWGFWCASALKCCFLDRFMADKLACSELVLVMRVFANYTHSLFLPGFICLFSIKLEQTCPKHVQTPSWGLTIRWAKCCIFVVLVLI